MGPDLLLLKAGELEIVLAPATGGSIARFTFAGGDGPVDVLRPASSAALAAGDPQGMGCFPMIPFCGRIAYARFEFQGESYQLPRNFGDSPHAIHGNAWQRRWRVVSHAMNSAELVLDHDPAVDGPGWPFAYTARQVFTLTSHTLRIAIEVTNWDRRAMPLGFGLHPYFPCTPEARLAAQAETMWENDESMLPVRRVPVQPQTDFAGGRRLAELALDNCFAGWKRTADLAWPELALALRIEAEPPFHHFVVYTPLHHRYFCAEPQSSAPDAVNLAARGFEDTGLTVLAPGTTQSGSMRFTVRKAAPS